MDEDEYLLHVAAGTDPITALAAAPLTRQSKKRRPVNALLMLLVLLAGIVWLATR